MIFRRLSKGGICIRSLEGKFRKLFKKGLHKVHKLHHFGRQCSFFRRHGRECCDPNRAKCHITYLPRQRPYDTPDKIIPFRTELRAVFDVHRISPKMKIQKIFGWKGVKHLLGKTPYQWKKKIHFQPTK